MLDETLGADADGYALELPPLPPVDAWWVGVDGTGSGAMIRLYALDADGNVIAETGTTWVRDIFCARPTAPP